jgi:segregation and condensation protein A
VSRASPPLEPYAGPLDLLLDEVRRQNIDLEAVALAPLVARYLDYLQRAVRAGQPLAIDWILLAATLIQWKSRDLLAPEADPAADPVRDELVEQLRAHRQDVARDLGRRRAEQAGQLSRDGDLVFTEKPVPEEPSEPAFLSVWDLAEQARDLTCWAAQRRLQQQRSQPFPANEFEDVPTAGMVEYLLAQFAAVGPELNASRLLAQQSDLPHRISLFLALLEMAQTQQLRIRQEEEFAEISLMLSLAYRDSLPM